MKQQTKNALGLAFRMAVFTAAVTAIANIDDLPPAPAKAPAAVTAPAPAPASPAAK